MFKRYQVGTKLIAQMRFPDGVVCLDIDAPDQSYHLPKNHDIMVSKVRELAEELSVRWDLGRFWMYYTGSPGLHVIFEHSTPAWKHVLTDALRGRSFVDDPTTSKGWHECPGHQYLCTFSRDRCVLRVGYKESRDRWDIFPLEDNPTEDPPDHIVEHDGYLRREIPVYDGATFVCPYSDMWPERLCAICQERDVCPGKHNGGRVK